MIGTIIKLAVLAVIILVALQIFAPDQADKVLTTVSEKTGMDKDNLSEKLNEATEFTKDTINEASQTVKDKIDN